MSHHTDRKIKAARKVAETLPPFEAQIIRELCNAHATATRTMSQLWHDNAALRRDMAGFMRATVLSEVQRIAARHSKPPQGGKSPVSGVTMPKTQEGPSVGRKMGKSA